ncbi:MAG: succinate dehydrogenase, hydrophobic membrane anchor protein [Pseudomonadota bacterium]
MRYLTDRKRVVGLGSGRDGTHHHWQMLISSILLLGAIPAVVITFAVAFGGNHDAVLTFFNRPLIALITILALSSVIWHVMQESIEAIEDYVHGAKGKLSLIAVRVFGYGLIAAGVLAILRMAL